MGWVQVSNHIRTGAICTGSWDLDSADVVCRQMGYLGAFSDRRKYLIHAVINFVNYFRYAFSKLSAVVIVLLKLSLSFTALKLLRKVAMLLFLTGR